MITRTPEGNIKAERVRNNLTQHDMAARLAISPTSYSYKEAGKRQFTLPEFLKVCEILHMKPEDLLY